MQPIKHCIGAQRRSAGLARCDVGAQSLELDGLQALGVLQQAKPGTDHFADVVLAAAFDLVTDKCLKVRAQGNTGGHGFFLTVNKQYYLPAECVRQNSPA